jgi:uncharacterized membrane protein
MATGMRQAKRPLSALLAGPYGHPYHPMLVTIPIGAWTSSLGFDVASHLASRPAFLTHGSEWLIAIGVAGAIAAGMIGFFDLVVIPVGTPAFRTACTHMFINVTLIVAYGADFAWRYRSSARGPVDARMIALSAACVLALCVSGYLGGKLTYRYGVRVATESAQADGYMTARMHAAPGPRPARSRRDHRA